MLQEGNKFNNIKIYRSMANIATNIFFASVENEADLDYIVEFINDNFDDSFCDVYDDCMSAEFSSRWKYPESLMEDLVDGLVDKQNAYIRILTYELSSEYISFRIFTKGRWDIRA